MTALPPITHAEGSHVWTGDGRRFVDLMTGYGAVFLGHGHPAVTARLREQAARVWQCGRLPTASGEEAEARLREVLPEGTRPGGLYSTGMEAAEFAIRLAACHTGRREFAAFGRSMHGKSAMTSSLCWDNAPVRAGQAHVLPFVDEAGEDEILGRAARLLSGGRLAAVLVEPIQGSNGGHEASAAFYERLVALCREAGTLCVFDEILTGLHRTGTRFYADRLAAKPDITLFAKCMANGFPASSLAIPHGMDIPAEALPGSTFSGNPLAAAAVSATLEAMRALDMGTRVADIEAAVRAALGGREAAGITLRGRGAMWMLELAGPIRAGAAARSVLEAGILVSAQGRWLRLLPAATIDLALLREACDTIAAACEAASR